MPNSKDFNHFDYNPVDININRSLFNMDHSVKFSCNVGEVIPFECIEVLPGDTFKIKTNRVVRLQPLVTPIFDEVIQDVYYFFCPNRLVWKHWVNFCGENTQGPWAPSTNYSIPDIYPPGSGDEEPTEVGWNVGTIADYFGIPPKVRNTPVNALPFRAYALICDQWFRSEAVMNPVNVSVDDGTATGSNGDDQVLDIELGGKPFIACKFFDYFTSGLPSPQRGNAAAVFPRNSYLPVESLRQATIDNLGLEQPFKAGKSVPNKSTGMHFTFAPGISGTLVSKDSTNSALGVHGANEVYRGLLAEGQGTFSGTGFYAFADNLYANLSANAFNINDLRTAFAIQRYLEKSARFGGRYITFIKGFFGIDSPDARLQRTEYLGGSRLSLNINSVEQTSATQEGTTPLGNVAGMSVTGDSSDDVEFSATEHGYLIGVSVLRYHHSYQQGVNRMWLRSSFTDFYLPTFAFLGEQEIDAREIFFSSANEDKVFAYQERWAEYRYLPNRIAGEFRSVADISLDMWHLADYYASTPTLSPEWLREDKTMLDRCLAVTSDVANQCLCDFYLEVEAARPLPMYSIPGMIDHY